MNFDRAFDFVIGVEKGYVNDPKDPGGETNFGISKKRYAEEDIKGMTKDRAKFLYRRDYWDPHGCETMEWGKALCVFDTLVNGGLTHKWWLENWSKPLEEFLEDWLAERTVYLADLPEWPRFGLGWMRRLFKVFNEAKRSDG